MEHTYIEENSLIDRYVRGTLSPEERLPFEEHFLDCPQCLEQLEIASSLRDAIRISAAEPIASPRGWMNEMFAWRWATALATACFVAALVPAVVFHRDLQDSRAELQNAKRAPERAELAPPSVYVLSQSRGVNETTRTIDIPASPQWIVFTIEVDASQFRQAGATLTDSSGKVIWRTEKLQAPSPDAVVVSLPSTVFKPGDYTLALVQTNPSGHDAPLAHFLLHAQ
jgi:anti-sigma factor RsiW